SSQGSQKPEISLRVLRPLRLLCFVASVGLRKPRFRGRVGVAAHAFPAGVAAAERHVADRRLRLGLDLRLALGLSAPRRDDEARTAFHDRPELFVARRPLRMLVAVLSRSVEQALLYFAEQIPHTHGETVHGQTLFFARVAPRDED